jgi:menaquinol-cytochrome c reductase iron-sulfur subunit
VTKKVSRRQFLTYTLGGTAGFLASGMLFPMVRFAVDPLLKKEEDTGYVDVGQVSEFNENPKAVKFVVYRKDGWYEPPKGETLTAWITKDEKGEILALSPICKHLGCTVNWNSNPQFKNQYFCPCHFGRYYKDGRNVPGTPPPKPLDKYKTKVVNGRLQIGPLIKT